MSKKKKKILFIIIGSVIGVGVGLFLSAIGGG